MPNCFFRNGAQQVARPIEFDANATNEASGTQTTEKKNNENGRRKAEAAIEQCRIKKWKEEPQ